MNIGVTGSIGAGKSFVAEILTELSGGVSIDTDQVCKELLMKNGPGYEGVVRKWGTRFLVKENSEIDRAKLRETIFHDSTIRKDLENILHPLVRENIKIAKKKLHGKLLVVEIPLLFETGWHEDFDNSLLVVAEHEVCLKRVMDRDKVGIEHVEKILDVQMSTEEKRKLADYVIDNSGEPAETRKQVEKLLPILTI